jgi:hypothetical protein
MNPNTMIALSSQLDLIMKNHPCHIRGRNFGETSTVIQS